MPLTLQQALHHVEQRPEILSDFQITLNPETRNVMQGLLEALQASGFGITPNGGNQIDYLRGFFVYALRQLSEQPREINGGFFNRMAEELHSQGYEASSTALKHAFLICLSNGFPIRSEAITDYAYRYYEDGQVQQQAVPW